jgi:ankyrin repeat protein/pimeloyl-ACP methyl ester carboxylesterase
MRRVLFLLGTFYSLALAGCLSMPLATEPAPAAEETAGAANAGDATADAQSNWRTLPAFSRLGLALSASPSLDVGRDAEIVLSAERDISILATLIEKATGDFTSGGTRVYSEEKQWRIHISFPESGTYELQLLAKPESAEKFELVAMATFRAQFDLDASGMLVGAVRLRNVERMRLALENGADPNTPMKGFIKYYVDGKEETEDGYPVFGVLTWYDAVDKQIAALQLLSEYGADFRVLTSTGSTVLSEFFRRHWGTPEEGLRLLGTLLELGADPNQETAYTYIHNNEPVHTTIGTLLDMERYGRDRSEELAAYIPVLIQYNADTDARWPWGRSLLENLFADYANGRVPMIRAYLQAGVDPEADDLQSLVYLVTSDRFDGDYELVSLALSCTTHLNDPDTTGRTFLHTLAERTETSPEVRRRLFDLLVPAGVDFYVSNRYGETPLMAAVKSKNTAMVEELLARGVDPKHTGCTGKNVFHVLPAEPAAVEPLVDRFLALEVDINARDDGGRTPLFLAAKGDTSVAFVRFLVSKGADPAIPDLDGLTARGNARNKGQRKLADYLASLGVPESSGGWPVGNESVACRAVLAADLAELRSIPVADLQAMTARTADGVPATPLHLAVQEANTRVISTLTARGVDWNTGDRYGRTPLELAILTGNAEVAERLLRSGADPNRRNDYGTTAFSRAIAAGSPLSTTFLDAGKRPDWPSVSFSVAVAGSVDLARRLAPLSSWTPDTLDACAMLGRTDLLAYVGSAVQHETKSRDELLAEARHMADVYRSYAEEAEVPQKGRNVDRDRKHKKGSYLLTLESWSPWLESDPQLDLAEYPVAVYVPEGYDGSEPFGLMISMMNPQSSSQFPKPEYLETLKTHRLLYVGFDPYNGIFYDASPEHSYTSHEELVLAAVYHMFGAYNVDRNRVYLCGFSWGGRLTGEIVPRQPRIFTGGIAVGGCFTSGARIRPSYPFARERAAMVLNTGDWDYNRQETFNGYNTFLVLGYEAYYFQEPRRGHTRISGENFEKAVSLLDAAVRRRIVEGSVFR